MPAAILSRIVSCLGDGALLRTESGVTNRIVPETGDDT